MRKLIAFFLTITLLLTMFPLSAFAFEDFKGNEGGITLDKEDAFPAIRDAFGEYLSNEVHIEKDAYLGIPVDLYVYSKVGRGSEIAPVLLYVINTNTERIGTESDVSILTDLIEEYIVMVVDYRNNSLTTPINVDQSVHRIHLATAAGTYLTYTEDGETKKLNILTQCDNWVLPAGYRIMRDIPYFNYKTHGVEGTLDQIVKVWNEDFSDTTHANVGITWGQKTTEDGRLVYNDENGVRCYANANGDGYVYEDGTAVSGTVVPEYKKLREGKTYINEEARTAHVRDTWAEDWWDCVKKDGTPVDLNLYLDIMYPAEPKEGVEIPVLSMAVSRQSTTGNWYAVGDNPEYIGAAMFSGYAGLLYEYGYVPMARRDHYGYFSDSPKYPDTTKTDWKYGLSKWIGVRASTAAIRTFRYYCDTLSSLSALNADTMGVICISKTGYNIFLGNEHPEDFPEALVFSDTQDESQEQPYTHYNDGTPIPSNVQAVYGVSGSSPHRMAEGFCPVYVSVGMQDANAYANYYKQVRLNAKMLDIESVHYSLPMLGHAYLVGMCEEFMVDTYASVMNFFDYHVAGREASIEYITPLNGSSHVGTTDTITVKFNASVSLSTVRDKVKIVNAKTGKSATGEWESLYGNTEWRFTPDGLDGGATYLVYVPKDTTTEDGRQMKSSKTAAFVTVPERYATGGTVADGYHTVNDNNNVYMFFDAPEIEESMNETLRFRITNERAAQFLDVYALSVIDEENPKNSILGEKIGRIQVAGNGVYDFDISDYLATVTPGTRIGFALVGEKQVGATALHYETYDSSTSTTTLKQSSSSSIKIAWSSLYDRNGNGGGSYAVTRTGSSYYFDNALGFGNSVSSSTISDEDFGRLFRIRMSVLAPEGESLPSYFRTLVSYLNPASTGVEQVVDWNDTTFINALPALKAGEWVDIDFYYHIDDPSYVDAGMKKSVLGASHDGTLYIDNYIVEEIVTDIELSLSVSPAIITHPVAQVDTTLLESILLESGSYGDTYFGTGNDLVIRGETASMRMEGSEKVYIKLDLTSVSATTPATIALNVTEAKGGTIAFYGITDVELGQNWSADTISWQNAPANDRFSNGLDPEKTALIQEITVTGIGVYTLSVWDFALNMKEKGASTATIIGVVNSPANELILSCDFEDADAGSVSPKSSGGTPSLTTSDKLAYPDGGKYAYQITANSTHSRVIFKPLPTELTAEDVGKSFLVKYHIYSEDGGVYKQCVRPGTSELQAELITLKAGEWTEVSYHFTVTPELIGTRINFTLVATGLGSLTGTEGAYSSIFYVDNIKLYSAAGDIHFTVDKGEEPPVIEADFDEKTLAISKSGGLTPDNYGIDISPVANGYGGTKAFWWTASSGTHRPMLTLFNSLDASMVGNVYEISYMFYATAAGNYTHYPRAVVDGVANPFGSAITPLKISYPTANTWQKVTATFTITQEMVDLKTNFRFAFEPNGFGATTANPVSCYVDDFTVYDRTPEDETEEAREPYLFQNGFESNHYAIGSGFESAQHGSKFELSDTNDRVTGGDGALKVLLNRNYNRLCFYNIIDKIGYNSSTQQSWAEGATANCLTSEDIGRKFRVSFYVKTEIAGTFGIFIGNHKATKKCTDAKIYTINETDEWVNVVYEFEVNQSMIDNRQALLVIAFSNFSYAVDGATLRTVYIDDFTAVEIMEGEGSTIEMLDKATISNRKVIEDGELILDRADSTELLTEGKRAVLLRYASDIYRNTADATLKLFFEKYSGQTVSVYGLTVDAPANSTYNNIMALNKNGTIALTSVFGGAPLMTFCADRESIDIPITEYLLSRDGKELLFLIVSDESNSSEMLYADFQTLRPAPEKDITSNGEMEITPDGLALAGNDVTFHYLESYKNKALALHTNYVFRLKITASEQAKFTLSSNGITILANQSLQNGELILDFTTDNREITSLTLTSDSEGFIIHSYTLSKEGVNTTLSGSSIELFAAQAPYDLSAFQGVYVGMTLTENAKLTVYLPEQLANSLSSILYLGQTILPDTLEARDGFRIFPISDIPIKDLAKTHTLIFHYKSGVVREVEINAMKYLSSLLERDETLALKQLVYQLASYALEAEQYFYGERMPQYFLLGKAFTEAYERYSHIQTAVPAKENLGNLASVIQSVGIRLGDAPSFRLRLANEFTGTVTIQSGQNIVTYDVTNGVCDESDILFYSPTGVYAASEPLHIKVEGTHNAEGDFGIGNYRAIAQSRGMTDVVDVVDALYSYISSAKAYQNA